MRVTSLHVYPLKGGRAVDVDGARVEPMGLADDRRWMLVGDDGTFVSQRDLPSMARLIATPVAGGLKLADGERTIEIAAPGPDAPRLRVRVWGDVIEVPTAPEAHAWCTAFARRPVRLVHIDATCHRPVDPAFARDGDQVSFADGFPLLLTHRASLEALAARLRAAGEPAVPMNRFRPNVVVAGGAAFAEDEWSSVRLGNIDFDVAKPCARCTVITIDQARGEPTGPEPLRTLAHFRRFGQTVRFGVNLIPRNLIPRNLIPRNLIPRNLIPRNLIPRNLIARGPIAPDSIPRDAAVLRVGDAVATHSHDGDRES